MFPGYLAWGNFIEIYNKFKVQTDKVLFIGGEATRWKFINEAILFLKNKNKKISLFSNGIEIINAVPDNVIINGTNLFNTEHKSTILKNISLYKEKNVKIVLRFNISEHFDGYVQEAIKVTKEYADSVSISILYPVKNNNKSVGELVYRISEELISNLIKVKISRATPLCLFTTEQRAYLEEKCSLKGKCALPTRTIVVNPDGKSIQPCVELPIIKDICYFPKSSAKIIFKNEIDCINNKTREDCINCDLFENQKCCGGCLAYK